MGRFHAVLLVSVTLAASGCGLTGEAATSSPPSPAPAMTAEQRYAAARPVAERYLEALAAGRAQETVALAEPSARSLDGLRAWMAQIPVGELRLKMRPFEMKDPDQTAVRVELAARLEPEPLSDWVPLGRRVLVMSWSDGGWKVAGDITESSGVRQVGLGLFGVPKVLNGDHVSVIHEAIEAGGAASQILFSADKLAPELAKAYGRDAAARHPVVFVVRNERQGERLSGVKITRREVPQGFVIGGTAYIEWPEWEAGGILQRDGVIAHELTHVASERFLGRSPHSMFEGLAMVHENRFVGEFGFSLPLTGIAAAYRSGNFPSLEIWGRRWSDWGLRDPVAVSLCYEDAQAMVAVILEKHGGPPALGRLAQAFGAFKTGGEDYTAAQVQAAFRRGLGVPFEQVVSEAHAYAAAHA